MVVDSNILVEYLNGDEKIIRAVDGWKENRIALFISSISFVETLSYSFLAPDDVVIARDFLSGFIFVPTNEAISEEAAFLRRKYGTKLADSIIAATAIVYKVPIATRDKQFRKIKEVAVVVP